MGLEVREFGATLGTVVRRSALVALAIESSAPLVLLAAPPGYGKSVLAAQIATQHGVSRLADCEGQPLDLRVVEDAVAKLAGHREQVTSAVGSGGTLGSICEIISAAPASLADSCLVLDDVHIGDGRCVDDEVWSLAQVLSQAGCRLVVCTRCEQPPRRAPHKVELIGADDLRFSLDEARELAASFAGAGVRDSDIADAWGACGGHAALLAVMTRALPWLPGGNTEDRLAPRLSALIAFLVEEQLSHDERAVLFSAALLRYGSSAELAECSPKTKPETLLRLSCTVPLLSLDLSSGRRSIKFTCHSTLSGYVDERLRIDSDCFDPLATKQAFSLLVRRGDLVRAAEVLRFIDDESRVIQFLREHGQELLSKHASRLIAGLFDSVHLSRVMGDASLLLLWSDALLELDDLTDALAKARAGRVLAEHSGAAALRERAIANSIDILRLLNRWEDAAALVDTLDALRGDSPSRSSAQARLAAGRFLLVKGDYSRAKTMLEDALESADGSGVQPGSLRAQADTLLSLLPVLARGAFAESLRSLAQCASSDSGTRARAAASHGNVATALLEIGRLERAMSQLRIAMELSSDSGLGDVLPVLGCLQCSEGQETAGLESIATGIELATALGAKAEAAVNRVYESMLLRAAQRPEEALMSAERAYERLSMQDFMDFRRLAALEVAASLLALGDVAAARAWAEPVVSAGFGENTHHAFRGAMVLAECDRIDGGLQAGIDRLAAFSDHVRSENSNFQASMYARAFPDLLAMIAAAVGVAAIPVHMLRMIPPETSERVMRSSRGYLGKKEWSDLGQRLFGAEQFAAFVERRGRPICHVRMFGGLDVTVGDRAIRERDWKKRKSRTVFAMLVLNQGREVPRDQLLDSVWPELPEERAKNNFYVAWSTMKSALMGDAAKTGPCPYVQNTGGRCRTVSDALRSDVDEFEELVTSARQAQAADKPEAAIEAYERLAVIYRGDLLPGDLYDDWFVAARDRFRFEFIASMMHMVDLLLERDDPCKALVYARRALHVDPYREDLYQAALKCHIAAGQRSAAIETFVRCKTHLAEELGLDPSGDTVELYQQILVMEECPRYDTFGLS